LNDLWAYNAASDQWSWLKGSSYSADAIGEYGIMGEGSRNNTPGSRQTLSLVFGSSLSKIYLFGGLGYSDSASGAPNIVKAIL
jgi:hypothetical protein